MKPANLFMNALICTGTFGAGWSFADTLVMPEDAKHLKTGLWEVTRTSEISAPPMVPNAAMLEGLDPAARARVEAVLKRQAAERATRGGGPETTSHTKRECITPEVLAKRQLSMDQDEIRHNHKVTCTPVVKSRSASTVALTADCNIQAEYEDRAMPAGQMHMEMRYEVKSPEETVTQLDWSGNIGGQASHNKSTMSARWLGSACGDVKPAN